MRNRLRKAGTALAWMGTTIAEQFGRDELLLACGLLLVVSGLWQTWRPGAFLVPGCVLLWIAMPSRAAFLERAPALPAVRKHQRKG